MRKTLESLIGKSLLRSKHSSSVALVAAGLLLAPSAAGLIVWEGQVMQEWPDQSLASVPLPPGVAAAEWPIGTYPDPKGEVWGLTIVVDFSDTSPAFTLEQVDAWLNQTGYSAGGINGSVRDYFWDNSLGQVDFRNEVVGIVRARQPKSYYEGGSGYERASELVNELIEAIDAEVDFNRFDNDGDGRTEAISIVYAGPSETFAQGLWPHAGGLRESRDGVRLSRYQMSQMGNSLGLYTFVHEVGHMLFGWPDLYGFGNYCVMGNSSRSDNPVGINDFYRADQGWIPVIDITEADNARYAAAPDAGGYRYVNPDRPTEAFFWSNVQATNRWSSLRGSGLVMLHFDYDIRTNNPPNPLSLAVVQADSLEELDQTQWPNPGSDPDDFFHAGTNNEFSSSTQPASSWNDGSESGLRVYEISADGPEMTFSVGHGTPDPGVAGAGGVGGLTSAAATTGNAGSAGVGGTGAASTSSSSGTAATGQDTASVNSSNSTTGAVVSGNTDAVAPITAATSNGSTTDAASTTSTTSFMGDAASSTTGMPGTGGASLGNASTSSAAPVAATSDNGCTCRLQSGRRTPVALSWALLALVALARRRREAKGQR